MEELSETLSPRCLFFKKVLLTVRPENSTLPGQIVAGIVSVIAVQFLLRGNFNLAVVGTFIISIVIMAFFSVFGPEFKNTM